MNCDPETAEALSQLAERYVFNQECASMVEAAAREAIGRDANCARAYYVLAVIKARRDETLAEAVAAASRAAQLQTQSAAYVYRLALILHTRLNELDAAETAYRHAIHLEPDNPF